MIFHFLENQTAKKEREGEEWRNGYLELKLEWERKAEEDEEIGDESCCITDIFSGLRDMGLQFFFFEMKKFFSLFFFPFF